MTDVRHEEVCALLLQAVRAAWEAGSVKIERGEVLPRYKLPRMDTSMSGWPLCLQREMLKEVDGDPHDWVRMLQSSGVGRAPIDISDSPSLQGAVSSILELAEADSAVRDLLSRIAAVWSDDQEKQRQQVEYELLMLIGNLIGQAVATGVETDEDLRELYAQIERGRTDTELRGDLVVPLALTAFRTDQVHEVVPGVELTPIDLATQQARAPHWVGTGRASPYVIAAATHALVIRDVTVPNAAWGLQMVRGTAAVDLGAVDDFIAAITVCTGRASGYTQILLRSGNWATEFCHGLPALWLIETFSEYPPSYDDAAWNQPPRYIEDEQLPELFEVFAALRGGPRNIKLSARRLRRSTLRTDSEDEIIDAVIGIEALLGEGRTELVHRISQRAALVLAERLPAEQTYALIKGVYAQRSTLVHGGLPKKGTVAIGEHEVAAEDVAVNLLIMLLHELLLSAELTSPESMDKAILARIGNVTGRVT